MNQLPSTDASRGVCAIALLGLVACDAAPRSRPESGTATTITIPQPRSALESAVIDPDTLDVVVTVDDFVADVSEGDDGEYLARFNVPEGEPLVLEITWVDGSTGDRVPLFALSSILPPITEDGPVDVEGSYQSVDSDDDGESNLEALEAGRDPFAARRSTALDERGVLIPRLPSGAAPPVIDGVFDESGVWEGARFNDVGGQLLSIDNLLIDEGAESPDGQPMYRWFALHDGESLYLSVLFEGARDVDPAGSARDDSEYTPFADSESYFDDDGLNLYIDGDASGRIGLDGVDDLYLHIPQLSATGEEGEVRARRPFAADSLTPVDEIDAASCVCRTGTSSWEIEIPLSFAGIEVGRQFGMEVQIDQDLDGGDIDAAWGWANPSIADSPEDFRLGSPRFNGTAVLTNEPK